VNRTDRLYALIEELRAISPRYVKAKELAARFGVSTRTIERDLSTLDRSGLPVDARPGRGYRLDMSMALPPMSFTPAEAAVIAAALSRAGDEQFAAEAASALGKLAAAMSVTEDELPATSPVAREIERALLRRHALRIEYADRKGVVTSREVEPRIFLGGRGGFWYLVAWCRLRDDVRVFRLDRIATAAPVDEGPVDGDAGTGRATAAETVGGTA
jgi:predicted DNA-binding transcriptional regulator YafY